MLSYISPLACIVNSEPYTVHYILKENGISTSINENVTVEFAHMYIGYIQMCISLLALIITAIVINRIRNTKKYNWLLYISILPLIAITTISSVHIIKYLEEFNRILTQVRTLSVPYETYKLVFQKTKNMIKHIQDSITDPKVLYWTIALSIVLLIKHYVKHKEMTKQIMLLYIAESISICFAIAANFNFFINYEYIDSFISNYGTESGLSINLIPYTLSTIIMQIAVPIIPIMYAYLRYKLSKPKDNQLTE